MKKASWRTLIVSSVIGVAMPVADNSTQAHSVLSPSLRTLLKEAAGGSESMAVLMARLASQAVPGAEKEILDVIAESEPDYAPKVAFALSHVRTQSKSQAPENKSPVQPANPVRSNHVMLPTAMPPQPRMFALEERGAAFAVRPTTLEERWEPKSFRIDQPVYRKGPFVSLELLIKKGIERHTFRSDEWRMDSLVQLNHDVTKRRYMFVTARYDKSPDTGYDYRALVAPGVGYRVYNRDDFTWRLEAGAGVRYDKADAPYYYEERFGRPEERKTSMAPAAMVASKITWKPRENITVENSTMGVVSDSSSVSNLTSVAMPLSDSMKVGFSFDMRFNTNRPYEDHSRAFDTIAKVTFNYKF